MITPIHIRSCMLSDVKERSLPQNSLSYGHKKNQNKEKHAAYGQSLVETGRERTKLVGLLEHEQILAYSQNLQYAFKKRERNSQFDFGFNQ